MKTALLVVCAASLSVGCASAHGHAINLRQSTAGSRRTAGTPGSWEGVAALRPGAQVVITLTSGDRLEGAFVALEPSVLRLTDPGGRPLDIARVEVNRVLARRAGDRLRNGALIGLGAAAAILGVIASGDGYVLSSAKWGAPLLLSAAGGLVGVFIDRAHRGDELLYVMP